MILKEQNREESKRIAVRGAGCGTTEPSAHPEKHVFEQNSIEEGLICKSAGYLALVLPAKGIKLELHMYT